MLHSQSKPLTAFLVDKSTADPRKFSINGLDCILLLFINYDC